MYSQLWCYYHRVGIAACGTATKLLSISMLLKSNYGNTLSAIGAVDDKCALIKYWLRWLTPKRLGRCLWLFIAVAAFLFSTVGLLKGASSSPVVKGFTVPPNSGTDITGLATGKRNDPVPLRRSITPAHGECHKPITFLQFRLPTGPSLFKGCCIFRRNKKLVQNS